MKKLRSRSPHHSGPVRIYVETAAGRERSADREREIKEAIRAEQRPATHGQAYLLHKWTGEPVEEMLRLTHRQAAIRLTRARAARSAPAEPSS